MKSPGLLELLMLALAGAVGTLARYGVYVLCDRPALKDVPAGTFIVNVVGCLIFGIVLAAIPGQAKLPMQTKWLILTGFLGAFTTFSAFAFEAGRYLQHGEYGAATLTIAANNVLGIGAFMLGWWASTLLVSGRGTA